MIRTDDGRYLFQMINPPYFRTTFTHVPNNPFAIMLFARFGRIDVELYEDNLEVFKREIVMPDPEVDLNRLKLSYRGRGPHKIFPNNVDIPENSYLFSLTNGVAQIKLGSVDLYDEIISQAVGLSPSTLEIYDFLGDYFRVEIKIFQGIGFRRHYHRFVNKDSEIEVYLHAVAGDVAGYDVAPVSYITMDGLIFSHRTILFRPNGS